MRKPDCGRKRFAWTLILASAIAVHLGTEARAAGVRFDTIPSVTLGEEYNSNVYSTSSNEVSSFGTRVTPTLALRFTSADNVMLQLSGSYDKIWYNKSEAKDAETNTWYFRVESSGGWNLTPNFSVLPSVYYLNTTDSYRRSQLAPSGDPSLPPVNISNYGNTKSYDFGGGLNFAYLVSPLVTVGFGGRYGEHRFSADNVANSGLEDSTQAGGDVSVSYLLSPRTKVGLLVAGNHQTFQTSPDANVFSAGVIYGYQFTEVFRLDATVGGSYIRQKAGEGTPEENKTSPAGYFTLTYDTQFVQARLYGSLLYSGLSGYGQPTREGTVGIGFTGNLSREWSWNLNGTYQISKSVFNTESVDVTTKLAGGGLQYKPWEWGSISLSGTMERQTSGGQLGSAIDNYSAILGFTVGKPYNVF
jgi:hypothetical protein